MFRYRRKVGLVLITIVFLLLFVTVIKTANIASDAATSSQTVASMHHDTEKVMTIGSSVTEGWMDAGWKNWKKGWFGGYLKRAFSAMTVHTPTHFLVVNHAIIGATPTQMTTLYKGKMTNWLQAVKPNVVVISWGILNDILSKTPVSVFTSHIHHEILNALDHHAVVLLITPPVTEAALTTYQVQMPQYLQAEIHVAQSFHNSNVYVFNLFDQMNRYMIEHHDLITQYVGNSWHPNAAGHELAGSLLYGDLVEKFGDRPILFHS